MGAKRRAPSRLLSTAARSPTTGSARSGDRNRGGATLSGRQSTASFSTAGRKWTGERKSKRKHRKEKGSGRNDGVFTGAGEALAAAVWLLRRRRRLLSQEGSKGERN